MKAKLSGVKNQILNMLSGAAISPKEYERLINALPDENRNEKDFAAKMTNFKQVQNDIIQEKLSAFKQGGYDTTDLEAGQAKRPEAQGEGGVPTVGGTFNGERVTKVTRVQ
jgi:hypothetical protein